MRSRAGIEGTGESEGRAEPPSATASMKASTIIRSLVRIAAASLPVEPPNAIRTPRSAAIGGMNRPVRINRDAGEPHSIAPEADDIAGIDVPDFTSECTPAPELSLDTRQTTAVGRR